MYQGVHGILFIGYLHKDEAINSKYYITLLDRLSENIQKKQPPMLKKSILPRKFPNHKQMNRDQIEDLKSRCFNKKTCFYWLGPGLFEWSVTLSQIARLKNRSFILDFHRHRQTKLVFIRPLQSPRNQSSKSGCPTVPSNQLIQSQATQTGLTKHSQTSRTGISCRENYWPDAQN